MMTLQIVAIVGPILITWIYFEGRLSEMSAELDAVKATAATLSTTVDTLLADYATAKANAVDPAELTGLNTTLGDVVTKINAAINPPAA